MNHIQNFLRQSLYLSKPHAIISRQSPLIVSRLYSTGGAAPDSITAIESAPRRNPVPPPADDDADKLYKVVELELRGNDSAVLKSFAKFAMTTANHLDIQAKSFVFDLSLICLVIRLSVADGACASRCTSATRC